MHRNSFCAMLTLLVMAAPVLIGDLVTSCRVYGAELPIQIRVNAGAQARRNTPVSLSLTELDQAAGDWQLVELRDGQATPTPCQLESTEPPTLWWILSGDTKANTQRTYEIRPGKPKQSTNVVVTEHDGVLDISRGEAKILQYNMAHVVPPPDLNPQYGRNAHLHPVWTPAGQIVTDQFPPDHAHQSGVFLAFTKTKFEGRSPDFWNLVGGTGHVRFAEKLSTTNGPVFGDFQVRHAHIDLTVPEGKVALNETWQVRAWNIDGPADGYWIYDIQSTIRCATDQPLILPEYHYGGMALRGGREWTPERCEFLTSNGKTRSDGNHDRAEWVDMSGQTSEAWSGITVMCSPHNIRSPQPVRIHPRMPYMVYTPQQLGDWELSPGKEYISHFRYLVHDGKLDSRVTGRVWKDYANPPTVTLQPKE